MAKVVEVVTKLHRSIAAGVDEIHPEIVKALDMVGLSWLTNLFNVG